MLVGWCVWVFGLCFVLACCFLASRGISASNLLSFLLKIPVVDGPFFFSLMAAWLNEVVVRAVALLSALTKYFTMHKVLY